MSSLERHTHRSAAGQIQRVLLDRAAWLGISAVALVLAACTGFVGDGEAGRRSPFAGDDTDSPFVGEEIVQLPQEATFVDFSPMVSPRMSPRVSAITAHLLQVQSGSLATCTPVSVPVGVSLSTAVNAAIAKLGAGAYCLSPGLIDEEIRVPPAVVLILMAGVYPQRAPVVLGAGPDQVGAGVIGQSAASTVLMYDAEVHGANVKIENHAQGYQVSGLTLTRQTTGSQDGDSGILTDLSNDGGTMQNLLITNQYDGVFLRHTGMSWFRNNVVAQNARNGIHLTSYGYQGDVAAQYFLHDTLVAMNGAWGVYITPYEGHICLENWDGLLSYGNSSGGVRAVSVNPDSNQIVDAVRMTRSMFSNDGAAGGGAALMLDAGAAHQITASFFEHAGIGPDGFTRSAGVPAIRIASEVGTALFDNVHVANATGSGIVTSGRHVLVNSSTFVDNDTAGIQVEDGRVQVTNNSFQQATGVLSKAPGQIVWASQATGTLYSGPPLDPASNDSTAAAPPPGVQPLPDAPPPPLAATQPYSKDGCTRVTPAAGQSLAAAINQALQSGPGFYCATAGRLDEEIHVGTNTVLLLSPGIYEQSASIFVEGSGAGVLGTTSGSTVLRFDAGAHGANIRLVDGVRNAVIRDLQLTRAAADGVAGDSGVYGVYGGRNEQNLFENLEVLRQFDGLYLGSSSGGWVRNVIVLLSTRHGILMTDVGVPDGPAAYTLDEVFVGVNKGFGILLSPDGGQMQMGTWTGVLGFANEGGMIAGTASAGGVVQGLTVMSSFFGADGSAGHSGEVTLMGGTNHSLYQVYIEGAGLGLNDSAPGTPSIYLGAEVGTVDLRAMVVGTSAGVGVMSAAGLLRTTASFLSSNGLMPASGSTAPGVQIVAGTARFVADYFGNDLGTQPVAIQSTVPVDVFASFADTCELLKAP